MQAAKKVKVKSSEEILEFQKCIFHHLIALPAQQIQQVIILVSLTNEPIYAFEKLTDKSYTQLDRAKPMMAKINKSTTLIYTTQAFLKPNISHNFVTMHYLMKTAKKVKFIYVFNRKDFEVGAIQTVKNALVNVAALFNEKQFNSLGETLGEGTGIIIHQSPNINYELQVQLNRFTKVYEAQYIKIQEVSKYAEYIRKNKRAILMKTNSEPILFNEQFCNLLKQLKYIDLRDNVQLKLQSSYSQYAYLKTANFWQEFFKLLYSSLIPLIQEDQQEAEQIHHNYQHKLKKQKTSKQSQLLEILSKFNFIKQKSINKTYVLESHQQKSLRLCNFMHCYLDIIISLERRVIDLSSKTKLAENRQKQLIQNEIIMKKLLKGLYESRYLSHGALQFFLLSYFKIYPFLSDKTNEDETDVFQIVQFSKQYENKPLFNDNMSKMISILFQLIQEQLHSNQQNNEYTKLIKSLNTLLLKLQNLKAHSFLTERTLKKLKKLIAQTAFKRAETATLTYNIPPVQINKLWLQFLHLSRNATLLDDSKIEKAMYFLADELTKAKQFKLSLKIFDNMPQFKVYKKVIAIYERDLKFNPQIMKYTFTIDWANKNEQFQNYCNFLLKLGFQEKVRGMVLQAMRIIEDEQSLEDLKGILINARGDDSRDSHIKFLQDLNQIDRSFVDQNLLNQIEYAFKNINRSE